MLSQLPIDEVMPDVVAALSNHDALVLVAPTGAGKTTRVPLALLDAGHGAEGLIVVLEPRRVAARAAARTMASLLDVPLGAEVGYRVRFDNKSSARTRILVVTEGILLRMLQHDPFLEQISVVVFDEFHERSVPSDLALAMVRRVQLDVRPDLKLLVMSATVSAEPVANWLDGCPIVSSSGRSYEVEVHYAERPVSDRLGASAGVIRRAMKEAEGDVLVFLPGVGEIERLRRGLGSLSGARVMALHGSLPPREQDAVLKPSSTRKVILATNVAETSLTIPGVSVVVDLGLAKVPRRDASTQLTRLCVETISRASAAQRLGRAGRERAGHCYRLWTRNEERAMADHDEPAICRADLAPVVLQLLSFGERDVASFGFFEQPPAHALEQALALLRRIGALGSAGLTTDGSAMASIPLEPRLARLAIEAARLGFPRDGALLAASLAERDPFTRRHDDRAPDLFERLTLLKRFKREGSAPGVSGAAAAAVMRSASQVADVLKKINLQPAAPSSGSRDDALRRAALAGFPDRVARRRKTEGLQGRAVMVGGRGVVVPPELASDLGPTFVCLELSDNRGERSAARLRMGVDIDIAWLDPGLMTSNIEATFDPGSERVSGREVRRYLDLELSSKRREVPHDEAARVLAAAAGSDITKSLGLHRREVAGYLARVRFVAAHVSGADLPPFDDDALHARLESLCYGLRSLAKLRQLPLVERFKGWLTWEQQKAVEALAPSQIRVPTGQMVALRYQADPERPPVLAVRIQQVFGLSETPTVAGGRVNVLLHLLAPNQRPQQVTDDLPSFWANTYSEIRKELRQRYPKHAWPEDPTTATAESRPQRRRSPKR